MLITEDKDFGELVFLRGQPHPAIVRLVEMTPLERVAAMRILIGHHGNAMREGAIVVVVAVLVSSDRDFVPVAEFLETRGIKVIRGAFPPKGHS